MKTILIAFVAVICLTFSSNAQTQVSQDANLVEGVSNLNAGPDVPPNCWKIGVPIRIYIGEDGCIEVDCRVVLGVCCVEKGTSVGMGTYVVNYAGNTYSFNKLSVISEGGDVNSYMGYSIVE